MCALSPPFSMATPATSLLAGFDFNLTSHTPILPADPAPPKRPPTPDPRHTPRPRTPHSPYHSSSPLPGGEPPRRIRRRPTAIFVGSDAQPQKYAHWPCSTESAPLLVSQYPSEPTLTPLLPFSPSTPSPRFATSPSLSSSGTTVQSSPTLTPTTAHFGGSRSEPKQPIQAPESFHAWDIRKGTVDLRRAKRLPHREQGVWEVHAVVHVSSGNLGKDNQGQQGGKDQGDQERRQQGGHLTTETLPQPPASDHRDPVCNHNPRFRPRRHKGFQGIHSESASREGGLRTAPELDTSSYSLSKFHFPAPPGNYHVGSGGTSTRFSWVYVG